MAKQKPTTARGKVRQKLKNSAAGKKGAKTGARRASFKKLPKKAKLAAFAHMDATAERAGKKKGTAIKTKRKKAAAKRAAKKK